MDSRWKPSLSIFAGMTLLTLMGCGSGGIGGTHPTPTAHNEWTWVSGTKITDYPGNYGTQGVASSSNFPGGRIWTASWIDTGGNLWLFGGLGVGSNYAAGRDRLNDLWKFDPNSRQWTWVGGSNQINQPGVYGTEGVASTNNIPGGRQDAVRWTDAAGNFWLFGGIGIDSMGTSGTLNDLWKYSPASNTWTWMSGSNVGAEPGIAGAYQGTGMYGTEGMASPGNLPGARFGAVAWTDLSGNLWLFGGAGEDSTGHLGNLNDLWKYSPKTNMWTWMSGPNIANQLGVYGTLGTAAPGNIPGARAGASAWADVFGSLWLFGGAGEDSTEGGGGGLNDMWKYNIATNMWTWMGGPDLGNQAGIYGTEGVAATGNLPWFRDSAASWTDSVGDFWLYGGDPNLPNVAFGDLWEYSPTTNLWTWVNGSDSSCPASVYGALGVPAPANFPGGRLGGASWIDKSGNLWFFGGENFCINSQTYNDLWEYQP